MLLLSVILILLSGFIGGQLAKKIGAPPLMGMIIAGILLGREVSNLIAPQVLNVADELRTIAVMVILMRAGLGLDRDKLLKQGNVALRLGIFPAIAEMLVVAILAIWLFQFDFFTGLLLGCVVSPESPAVIVPGMLKLKNIGWGVAKGIPDAILTGSALSDVLVLLIFSLLLNILTQSRIDSDALWFLPLQVIGQIVLGISIGYLAAKFIVWWIVKRQWTQNVIQSTLFVGSLGLLIVVVAQKFPYFSGYLSTMAMGFFSIEFNPPLARRLRSEFNHLWIVAEIFLFVLMGATIQLKVLEQVFFPGIILLVLSLICGRTIGWYFATLGSNWNWREKLFLLPGNSAKATVQAAIGGIPLSANIPGGEIILAIAALAILITAPLGAWAIPTFAPKLLTKDAIDPTKTAIANKTLFLAAVAVDDEPDSQFKTAIQVLTKVADLARRSHGEVIIVHVTSKSSRSGITTLQRLTQKLLLDIHHQFIVTEGLVPEEILKLARFHQVTNIVMGKKDPSLSTDGIIGSVSQAVLSQSNIPVTLV